MRFNSTFIVSIGLMFAAATVIGQPAITLHPKSRSVSLGAKVTFQVKATGAQPLSYQWRRNTVDIPQATTASLALSGIQLIHAGDYVAVVTDASGSVTSKVATLEVDPTFTKITDGDIVNDAGASNACAWGDYDNDGWPDLFVNNYNRINFLYRNKRDGTFERIRAGHMVLNTATHLAGVWGDYDNDGFLDLLVVNGGAAPTDGSQANFLYHNNGNGTFSQPSATTIGNIITDAGGFHGAAWADYDGDGFLDVFVANSTGPNRLYQNIGGRSFVGRANLGMSCVESAWADYDNDGDLDLVVIQVANANSKTLLYRNDGHGLLTLVTSGSIPQLGRSAGCSWGDYNNDGFFDLFMSTFNAANNNFLYRNKRDGTFEKDTLSPSLKESADPGGVAWGDYDNDGFLDLFVANGVFGSVDDALFRNKGDGTFQRIMAGSPSNDQGSSIACAWADYNNDGFLDLFVPNNSAFSGGPAQSNFLYRNNGNANNWLKVRCVGTLSNQGGIGAKVRVKANFAGEDRWQLRQIASADGRTGGSLEAHFGLGDATIIETLRIEWPSGIVQELHRVNPKQSLIISEPIQPKATGWGTFSFRSWKGMIFQIQASTDLKGWSPLTEVTNLTGTVEFTDSDAAEYSHRFYRIVPR